MKISDAGVEVLMLTVDKNLQVKALWNDDFADILPHLGSNIQINRASRVEPEGRFWYADLAPVGGPKLGPFKFHKDAIKAEIEWLAENVFHVDAIENI